MLIFFKIFKLDIFSMRLQHIFLRSSVKTSSQIVYEMQLFIDRIGERISLLHSIYKIVFCPILLSFLSKISPQNWFRWHRLQTSRTPLRESPLRSVLIENVFARSEGKLSSLNRPPVRWRKCTITRNSHRNKGVIVCY